MRLIPALLRALVACTLVLLGTTSAASAATNLKFVFQPTSSTAPLGYTADNGAAYSAGTGRGWVTEASVASGGTGVPLNMTSQTRDRTYGDPLQRVLIQMQPSGSTAGAFEVDVPNGAYDVALSMGDRNYVNSTYRARVEQQLILPATTPTTSNQWATASGRVNVTDGKLTLDAVGATNAKLNWLTIDSAPADTTPPAAPANLAATPSTTQVVLNWSAGTEPDLSGYNVYRSATTPVPTNGTPLNAVRIAPTATTFTDTGLTSDTDYNYAVVAYDTSGNPSVSTEVLAHTTPVPPGHFEQKVNFQLAGFPTPSGYTAETGGAYSSARTMGFVTAASLSQPSAGHTPIDVSADRPRTRTPGDSDPRLNSLIQLDSPAPSVAWEIAVPNGIYDVVVGAGDPGYFNSTYKINVEGTSAINATATTGSRSFVGTAHVHVVDGRLTIDGLGGTNGKLQYVDISGDADTTTDTTPPAVPTGVAASGTSSAVNVSWTANTEPDLRGYRVFRSTTTPVVTTPYTSAIAGATTPIAATSFADTTAAPGTTYYYAVTAVDTTGNTSAGSTPASGAIDTTVHAKYIFQPSSSSVPLGYTADTGAAYSAGTGRGWVTEASVASGGTGVPLDMSSQTRDRGGSDPLTRVLIQMQPSGATAGAFEVAVPNGAYDVSLSMGDPNYFNSTYRARVEQQLLLPAVNPTSANRFATASGRVNVTDGKLTLDAVGASNAKLNWLTIDSTVVDTTPPAAPSNVVATPSTDQVVLNWDAGTDSDLSGYNVYRSATTPVPTGSGATPLNPTRLAPSTTTFQDTGLTPDTDYYYAVVAYDTSGNKASSADVLAHTTAVPPGYFTQKINFQLAGFTTPSGYTAETGGAYSDTRTMGFVTAASLAQPSIGHVPVDVSADRPRTRTASGVDPRLNSLIQLDNPAPSVAWEVKVPNGIYDVTVAAGDPSYFDSTFKINVEGTNAINATATSASRSFVGTAHVHVLDGRLTIDGTGGTNGKLQYVELAGAPDGVDTTAPVSPTGLAATTGTAQVNLAWNANSEPDLAGYRVYRSTTVTVDTSASATPISGTGLVGGNAFTDTTAVQGTQYYYAVTAVDTSGNASTGSTPVGAKVPIPRLDRKINFQLAGNPVVSGWEVDSGEAYNATRGYGWITEASARKTPSNHVPYSFASWSRERNKNKNDKLLDTLVHMQPPNGGDRTKGAWDITVPNGSYDVSFSVGDPSYTNSKHVINVEGQNAMPGFYPTKTALWGFGMITVKVTDGRLTVDAQGGGTNTKLNWVRIQGADSGARPGVGVITPADGSTLVSRGRAVTAEVVLPTAGAGVDQSSLTSANVYLQKVQDGTKVPAAVNTSGGGDVIVLKPTNLLEANTQYRFVVTNGVKDESGASFIPKTTSFSTGTATGESQTDVKFTQHPQTAGQGNFMASVEVGPDHRLYATTLDGKIIRFPINPDGSLGTPTTITTVADHENAPRNIIGLAFDPASTSSNPILWVSHGSGEYINAPDWSGKISKLYGPDLSQIQDVVVGLPRSVRDHETNSIRFGADGKLYIVQGSQSAMGAPDNAWGLRAEHVLNAAMLQLDPSAITAPPLDVQTEDGGTYDPFASGAPLKLYATGIRNSYDFVFHSNGQTYASVNGSAAGGNTPGTPGTLPSICAHRIDYDTNGAYTGPSVPGLTNVDSQPDLLVRVQQNKYYGHPNPKRCEWAFFGANPTTGTDLFETSTYPTGTLPDRNWVPGFDLGYHQSVNGMVEFKGSQWGGELNGALVAARYSAGDDLVALQIDPTTKDVTTQIEGIPGMRGIVDPIDVTEDGTTGNLYVTEMGNARIMLLTPDETAGVPHATFTPSKVTTDAEVGSAADSPVTIKNTGNADLSINSVAFTGPGADSFSTTQLPVVPTTVRSGNSLTFNVHFAPTAPGVQAATLTVTTNDPDNPTFTREVRGLGHVGEPSLQRIADVYASGMNIGDDDPSTPALPAGTTLGDEVVFQTLSKASGASEVEVDPIATFGTTPTGVTFSRIGWHGANDATDLRSLSSIPSSDAGRVNPAVDGAVGFDPGGASFGLHVSFPALGKRTVYTEDGLNTIVTGGSHQARAYKLKDTSGAVIPNQYLVGFEETTGAGLDYNDLVVLVKGVEPDATGGGRVKLSSGDGLPFGNRLVMSRIGSLTNPPATNVVHDKSTVNVKNNGTSPLVVSQLSIVGPFQLSAPPTLPATVAPGATLPVQVQFVATSGHLNNGKLTITTDSTSTPSVDVDLAGWWQSQPENQEEPSLATIVNGLFGFGTTIAGPGDVINGHGHVETIGDEVLAPYWRVRDSDRPAKVQQLAAYHGASGADLKIMMKGANKATDGRRLVYQNPNDYQSVLPHINPSTTNLATATFTPPASFALNVGSEWTDPALNDHTKDRSASCVEPCGHHWRAWPAKDATGKVMPGMYIATMDYSGVNYDYNDNVYLLSNVEPDNTARPVIARLTTGATSAVTDGANQIWSPDTGLFTPTNSAGEGANSDTISGVLDTKIMGMYRTYRGNNNTTDQSQRTLTYSIPTEAATNVDIRLYFAERFFSAANQRVFDVSAEGVTRISNFDIYKASGAKNFAWSTAITDVPIYGGDLNLKFSASVNYPAISGIEVICNAGCSAD